MTDMSEDWSFSKKTFCRFICSSHTHSWWNLYKLFLLVFTFDSCFHNCLQRPEEPRLSMPDQCHNVMNEKPEAQRGKALQCVSSVPLSSLSSIKDKSKIKAYMTTMWEKANNFQLFVLIYNENGFMDKYIKIYYPHYKIEEYECYPTTCYLWHIWGIAEIAF